MENPDYNLLIRTPVHKLASKTDTPTSIPGGNITERVQETWQRNKVWSLGDDIGRFSIIGDIGEVIQYYNNWLTFDVAEISGGITTWNGRIVKMTLNWGVMPLTFDISDMYNKVTATIGDGIGTYTAAAENTYSQEAYGLRHEFILPGVETTAEANAERDAFLASHAWPSETPSGGDASRMLKGIAKLDVYAAGYKSTLNDLYADDTSITPADGVSTALEVVIGDALYVNDRSIGTNSTKLYDDVDLIKTGDLVEKLMAVSDGSSGLFRGWIDGNRNFYYRAIDNTPAYVIRNGKVFGSAGSHAEISPRLLEPGIYRNLDLPVSGPHRDSFFADRRDIWVDGIFVDREGRPRWQPEASSVADYQTLYWAQA